MDSRLALVARAAKLTPGPKMDIIRLRQTKEAIPVWLLVGGAEGSLWLPEVKGIEDRDEAMEVLSRGLRKGLRSV